TYVGHTNDIKRRLRDHNSGKTVFSKRYAPWSIIYQEQFETLIDSVKREKYLKSATGRRWIKRNVF
ncbi:MAG: GIY-YIG nuclease family protein, partial [Patescibacteria group bacterium]